MIANSVMNVDEFLATVDGEREDRTAVQPGAHVRGSDDTKFREVEKDVPAWPEHEAYMFGPCGMILETDTYIFLDTVVERARANVFITVPKLVVGRMPWGEPPTQADWQAKHSPRPVDVDILCGSRSPSSREGSAYA